MVSNWLKIYPSGFFGSNTVPQTQPMDLLTTAQQLFNKSLTSHHNQYTSNLNVLELWTTATSGTDEYKTFDYKEKILKCALSAFGEERLVDWLEAQYKSPDYSDNHSRWIDETISFVYGGKCRELSHNNWITLLTAGSSSNVKKEHSLTVKSYLFNGSMLGNRSGVTMRQFILNWVRQSDGIEDLLSSLNVLYGRR